MYTGMETESVLYLGIDGGGSKCRARIAGAGREGVGVAGPANPFQNLARACESIQQAAELALADAGLPANTLGRLVAGAGLAGVNIPHVREQLLAWRHPFSALYLTDDIQIAFLGAHAGAEGAVIVAGTGSVGYSSLNGGLSIGAHGFPFADKGSGAWLGLKALEAALLALDALGPDTALLPALEEELQARGLGLVGAMAGAGQREYGRLAPRVLAVAEAGDAVAVAIVREGVGYLEQIAERFLARGHSHLCLLGGLADHLLPWLGEKTLQCLQPPRGQPDEGALLYARQCHGATFTGQAIRGG
ncbi:BadF/BadG/BcrA/BcrD ATPase family protein [Microbulbifer spongiae]|uniref:ATPase n=1 Tax=Microbulbifer spongiae TaxID=2944933 RepID=A0ABY9EEU5_9GAMM|nr:BadF/BadG/BcrA/BcrD ATPase family protein [Microbulbifer sp. MI-G]WKD49880.1 ATPase [Microbulbifer sp. MI-G]